MWERKTIFVSLSDEDVWELWLFLEGVGTCAPEPEPEPGEPAGFKDRCCSEAWMTLDPRSCGGTPEAEPGRRSHTHGFNQVFIVVKGLHTSPWRRICVSITNKPSAVNFSHTWTCVCVWVCCKRISWEGAEVCVLRGSSVLKSLSECLQMFPPAGRSELQDETWRRRLFWLSR